MPALRKRLFAEAVCTSAIVKFSLLFMPFNKVSRWLGNRNLQVSETQIPSEKDIYLVETQKALKLCDKYTPWPTECYTQALTAKILLHKRAINSVLYIGFKKGENNHFEGHAWLISQSHVITGHCDFSQYQVHSFFS
ncbi:lasso peptide biosynthesis B2 protein [Emticicia sp. C21]|nr:lasso peptide biosynthesis B2 protein [Emticicia sp. C21]